MVLWTHQDFQNMYRVLNRGSVEGLNTHTGISRSITSRNLRCQLLPFINGKWKWVKCRFFIRKSNQIVFFQRIDHITRSLLTNLRVIYVHCVLYLGYIFSLKFARGFVHFPQKICQVKISHLQDVISDVNQLLKLQKLANCSQTFHKIP